MIKCDGKDEKESVLEAEGIKDAKVLRQEKLCFFTKLKGWWNRECRGKGHKTKLCVMRLVTQSWPTLCVPIWHARAPDSMARTPVSFPPSSVLLSS